MRDALLAALQTARQEGRPVALATPIEGEGEQRLVAPDDEEDPLRAAARTALRTDKAQNVELDGTSWFIRPYNPPLRLIVVGAVHIAQPLVVMAREAGFAVTVVDPRAAFAAEERFPGVTLTDDWPDEALEALRPDVRTAIVTLTHDPKLDDPALRVALGSPAFYIGSLGSSRTHASRLGRLERAGFDEAARARIHGPVGLSIHARSPAEIAVSILAEIVQTLRAPPAEEA